MRENFNLDSRKVLDKEFHVDLKGYSIKEVDEFLDKIIQDYDSYEMLIRELGIHLQRYEAENIKLRNKVKELETQIRCDEIKEPAVEQIDILKRISHLENAVFKK